MKPLLIFIFAVLLATLLQTSPTKAVNPVTAPIIQDAAFVHTREYAQLPKENGNPAKIVCIIPFSRSLFICTLNSIYRISSRGSVSVFLDVKSAISSATDRELDTTNIVHGGLRSIAFPPNFWFTGMIYISAMETRPTNTGDFHYISDVSNAISADSVLLEFRYNFNSRAVDPSSYRNVFRVGMPRYDHTIRQMAFLGDALYIAHGDGSQQDALVGGGQNGDARGKILRIIPYKPGSGNLPYSIPKSNPFVGNADMPDEVYALGFRNPHHICFGRDGTLYVADTGRSNVEEVNIVKAGGNYGWSLREGTFVHSGSGILTGVDPLPEDDEKFGFEYPNAQVGHEGKEGDTFVGQAIAGGCPVENGSPMNGRYWYSDFPLTGRLYFSEVQDLKNAITKGRPEILSQARTFEAVVCLEKNGETTNVGTLGGAVRADDGLASARRVDVRFGRGRLGELYWSSKTNGKVYVITSSIRGGPDSTC